MLHLGREPISRLVPAVTKRAAAWIHNATVAVQGGTHRYAERPCERTGTSRAVEISRVRATGNGLEITWGSGEHSTFHREWLFRNRPENMFQTGQNLMNPTTRCRATVARVSQSTDSDGGIAVKVHWDGDPDVAVSTFPALYLRQLCHSNESRQIQAAARRPEPLTTHSDIASVEYASLESEDGVREWLELVNRHGLCLVKNVPTVEGEVSRVAGHIGPAMHTIYGQQWDVVAVCTAPKSAFLGTSWAVCVLPQLLPSSIGLQNGTRVVCTVAGRPWALNSTVVAGAGSHQRGVLDARAGNASGLGVLRVAARAPAPALHAIRRRNQGLKKTHTQGPGCAYPTWLCWCVLLQLQPTCIAHCARMQGGESSFVDAFHAAELLRASDPQAFATLARVPATFQKIHYDRPDPVHMQYRRPHIQLNHEGAVVGVFWAPPFEGPLNVPESDVEEYFRAYHLFADIFEGTSAADVTVKRRLKPGELMCFNNRRMLHGRTPFTQAAVGGGRHLQGCYVTVESFVNRLRVLQNKNLAPEHRRGGGLQISRVGNGDYS